MIGYFTWEEPHAQERMRSCRPRTEEVESGGGCSGPRGEDQLAHYYYCYCYYDYYNYY